MEDKKGKQTVHIEIEYTPDRVTYFCGVCKLVLLTQNDWRKSLKCPTTENQLNSWIATHGCFKFQPVS